VAGGSAQQRALMASILHELGASSIERVWIGNEPHQGRAGVPPGPHWLALRIRAHTGLNDTRDLPGRAQAMLAADLFARSSAASGLPPINGASLHLDDPDGRRLYATSWRTSPQRSRLLGWSQQGRSLRTAIARAAISNGFRVGSIRLIGTPVEAAEIVVTATSPHGMRLHPRSSRGGAAAAPAPGTASRYVVVLDVPPGQRLRTAGRRRWCRRSLGRPAMAVPEFLDDRRQGRGDLPTTRARLLTHCVRFAP
jgi:hypothetical protein